MESPDHSLSSLFVQLGLDSSDQAIERFIAEHTPVAHHIMLHEAGFWNAAQADFLKQAVDDDADWAIVVDRLDSLLR